MSTAFMSISKMKDSRPSGGIDQAFAHNMRLMDVPNAAQTFNIIDQFKDNQVLNNYDLVSMGPGKSYNDIINERIGEMNPGTEHFKNRKTRKDAVKGIEVILTYTRDFDDKNNCYRETLIDLDNEERKRWEQENITWLREQFKDPITGKDNLISAVAHYDEQSPHIHAVIVPEVGGRLNASYFLGGKAKMHTLQRSYSETMSKEFGLKQSRYKSKMKNEDIALFYQKAKDYLYDYEYPTLEKDETVEQFEARIMDEIKALRASHMMELERKENEIREVKTLLKTPENYNIRMEETVNARDYYRDQAEKYLNQSDSYLERLTQVEVENKKESALLVEIDSILNSDQTAEQELQTLQELMLQNQILMDEIREQEEEEKKKKREKEKEKTKIIKEIFER